MHTVVVRQLIILHRTFFVHAKVKPNCQNLYNKEKETDDSLNDDEISVHELDASDEWRLVLKETVQKWEGVYFIDSNNLIYILA